MPLAGENYAPEPGYVRSEDARQRRLFEEEFSKNSDPTSGRQLTPREKAARAAADYWLDKHKQEEARESADKVRRLAAQRAGQDAERQQEEREQRRRDFAFRESQVDALLASHGTSEHERAAISQAIASAGKDINDPTVTWMALMQLRAKA
jgi:hypothetical protein